MSFKLASILALSKEFVSVVQDSTYRELFPRMYLRDCSDLLHDLGGLLGEW